MSGEKLHLAKQKKEDEFYTQMSDIESELRYYKDYFRDKTVLCNCDDPFESNFFKYFSLNFNYLGLRKLIATCYAGSPIIGKQLSLNEINVEEAQINEERLPYKIEITQVTDENSDGAIDLADIKLLLINRKNTLTVLKGNGDFRSHECIDLLIESDIVVTNPPFSLFREYVSQLVEYGKKFIIIGNKNAITYKDIFYLIKSNEFFVGNRPMSGGMWFIVPNEYEYDKIVDGLKLKNVPSCWFTNFDIQKRHEFLTLYKQYNSEEYPEYDNYHAIEVSKTTDIPYDFDGVMGVPISFLDKYNPDQFEIVGITKTWFGHANKTYPNQVQVNPNGRRSIVSKLNDGATLKLTKPPAGKTYYIVDGECFEQKYARILVRNKRQGC